LTILTEELNNMKISKVISPILALISLSLLTSACGGGSSGGNTTGEAQVSGRAIAPSTGLSGSAGVPLANATVTVVGVLPSRSAQVNADTGMTDADGNYNVTLPEGGGAIVVNGEINGNSIRISGLLQQQSNTESKDFNEFTDIACQAFISALNSDEVAATDLTNERIQNLENAAIQYLASNQVNFFDPASVTEAALAVRAQTGNGAFADVPVTPTPVPTPSSCEETTCSDGFPICVELVCNGTVDCADGSDESEETCGGSNNEPR
jgi:hypothetical protein